MGRLIFLTGGIRSGKSGRAVDIALTAGGPVLFVATAGASDEEMRERIENHRSGRPAGWRTAEALTGTLAPLIAGGEPTVLLDCLTLYVGRRVTEDASAREVLDEVDHALSALEAHDLAIVVSNEVGSGVVPDNALARFYSEVLGSVNALVARRATEVYLMVSGIPVRIS